MTILQAVALRMKWNQLPYTSACEHRNLELEWDDLGYSGGKYVCIVCGEICRLQPEPPLLKGRSNILSTREGKHHGK
jgi:hypothetical protein